MALGSMIGVRGDPPLSHNFAIALLETEYGGGPLAASIALAALFDVALGGFSECSGLEMSMDVHEYPEGGQQGYVHQFPTRVRWSHITLQKGIGAGTGLWDWHYGFAEGRGRRRDGVIALLNDLMLPNNIWYFHRGLPVRYSGPALNAQENRVAIESIEIAHEGVYQVPWAGYANAAVSFAIDKTVSALT